MKSRFHGYHSPFASAIERYLAFKRALNRRFDNEERSLRLFDRYLVEQNITEAAELTTSVVEAFMVSRPRARPRSYNHLLGVLQQWFSWMRQQGEMAVALSLPRERRATSQYVPFLFDQALAKRLLDVTNDLPDQPKGPGRAMTYRMIFVLLYGLGLRVGEVCRLRCDDVDLRRDLLIVRESKFGKSRWVPFGPKIAAELVEYLEQARHRNWQPDSALFSFNADRAVNPGTVSMTFHHLLPSLHLEIAPGVASPRLHHLRHSFAVGTLLRWYRSGIEPGRRLLRLSTFMGHVDPASTAIYLTITSDLLNIASERFEQFALHGGDQP
jgi:site-specific recombinase XerD